MWKAAVRRLSLLSGVAGSADFVPYVTIPTLLQSVLPAQPVSARNRVYQPIVRQRDNWKLLLYSFNQHIINRQIASYQACTCVNLPGLTYHAVVRFAYIRIVAWT